MIRTPDLLVRSQTLYPAELRAHRRVLSINPHMSPPGSATVRRNRRLSSNPRHLRRIQLSHIQRQRQGQQAGPQFQGRWNRPAAPHRRRRSSGRVVTAASSRRHLIPATARWSRTRAFRPPAGRSPPLGKARDSASGHRAEQPLPIADPTACAVNAQTAILVTFRGDWKPFSECVNVRNLRPARQAQQRCGPDGNPRSTRCSSGRTPPSPRWLARAAAGRGRC